MSTKFESYVNNFDGIISMTLKTLKAIEKLAEEISKNPHCNVLPNIKLLQSSYELLCRPYELIR